MANGWYHVTNSVRVHYFQDEKAWSLCNQFNRLDITKPFTDVQLTDGCSRCQKKLESLEKRGNKP